MQEESGSDLAYPAARWRDKIPLQELKNARALFEIREPNIDPIALPSLLLPKRGLLKCTLNGMWIIDSMNTRVSALLV